MESSFIASPVSESEDFAHQSPLQHSFVVLSDDDPLPFLDTAERDALSSTPPLHLPEKVRGLTESVEIRKRLETYLRDLAAPPENCALCRPCAAELETAVASEIDSNRERITRYEDELNRIKEEGNKGGDDAEHKKKRNGGNGRISNRPWMDAKVFGDEDCITQKTNKTVKASSEALDAELEELRKLGWEYTEVEATVWEDMRNLELKAHNFAEEVDDALRTTAVMTFGLNHGRTLCIGSYGDRGGAAPSRKPDAETMDWATYWRF